MSEPQVMPNIQHNQPISIHVDSNAVLKERERTENYETIGGHRTATARVSNIEMSTTEEDVATYFQGKGLSLADDTKISFVNTDADYKSATVSFFNEETLQRAISLPRVSRKLKSRTLNLDVGFEGFTVLAEGRNPEKVE